MILSGHRHARRRGLRSPDGVEHSSAGVAPATDEIGCYRLVSIDAVPTPEGCAGNDWFIYRIVQRENAITGYRRGPLARVKTDVDTIVMALNGRRDWTTRKGTERGTRGT
jgi:hypothetical protein